MILLLQASFIISRCDNDNRAKTYSISVCKWSAAAVVSLLSLSVYYSGDSQPLGRGPPVCGKRSLGVL